MPGSCLSPQNIVSPLCLGASGLVRQTTMPKSEKWAPVVHTFWPEISQSPEPSEAGTALVRAAARSEPPEGSENNWHQISSPRSAGPTKRALVASSAKVATVGTHMPRLIWKGFGGIGYLASSWLKITCGMGLPPAPPHSFGQGILGWAA